MSGSDTGSSPIETVALLALLLLPVAPLVTLFGHLSDAMAAESIARHGLRSAILEAKDANEVPQLAAKATSLLASSWQKSVEQRVSCQPCAPGGLIALEVRVGSAAAIQVAGLEPD